MMDRNQIPNQYIQLFESLIPEEQEKFIFARQNLHRHFIVPFLNFIIEATKKREDKELKFFGKLFSGKDLLNKLVNQLGEELGNSDREEIVDLCSLLLFLSDYVSISLRPEPDQSNPAQVIDKDGNLIGISSPAQIPSEIEYGCGLCGDKIDESRLYFLQGKYGRMETTPIGSLLGTYICDECRDCMNVEKVHNEVKIEINESQ